MADSSMPAGLTRTSDKETLYRGSKGLYGKDVEGEVLGKKFSIALDPMGKKLDRFILLQGRLEQHEKEQTKREAEDKVKFYKKDDAHFRTYQTQTANQRKYQDKATALQQKNEDKSELRKKISGGLEGAGGAALKTLLGPLAGLVDPMAKMFGSKTEREQKKIDLLKKKAETLQKTRDKNVEDHATVNSKKQLDNLDEAMKPKKGPRVPARKALPKGKDEGQKKLPKKPNPLLLPGGVMPDDDLGDLDNVTPFPGLGGLLDGRVSGGSEKPKTSVEEVGVFNSGMKFAGALKIDTIKKFDPGSALIAKILGGEEGKGDEKGKEKKGNFLDTIMDGLGEAFKMGLPGIAKLLSGNMAKAGGAAAIAAGLTWAIMDGVSAMKNAKDWGVSDFSAFLGGFLGGSSGKSGDWMSALAGAGKFGLIGAGVGIMFGPVGMIVGALMGAILGGIMGWIGAEGIADFTQTVINSFDWMKLANADEMKNIMDRETDLAKKLAGSRSVIPGRKLADNFKFTDIDSMPKKDQLAFSQYMSKKEGDRRMEAEFELSTSFSGAKRGLLGDGLDKSDPNIKKFIELAKSNFVFAGKVGLKNGFSDDDAFKALTTNANDLAKKYYESTTEYRELKALADAAQQDANTPATKKSTAFKDLFSAQTATYNSQRGLGSQKYEVQSNGLKDPVTVNDAIITKSGQVIHTDPKDNLYAFKSLPDLGGSMDGKAGRSLAEANRTQAIKPVEDEGIARLVSAIEKIKGGSNVTQMNQYTDRFSQANLLDSLTMEVS